ncbi:reverse transcriptase [Gossypium australe]|uniref:Reverse transcriptase n=1 Tax=Gossypium australe TaxID=47621 RepID=A0A5B6X3H0_9ROSI|nr:reverse transcriptase [Gossypium australe]
MAKAITNRFRGVLEKCIDDARSAFVPGRLISDNEMMRKMGFDPNWINSIMKCTSTVSYSVVLNGQAGDIFHPTRGLRQGDPLSLFLFLICGEGLSSLMRMALRERHLKGIVAFYGNCLGQRVNFDKSTVFFSSNTKGEENGLVTRILGARSSNDPERYLGLSNMVGRRKKEAFQNLKDRFKQRIDNWSIQHLSQCGKEVFIKAILQVIPTYTMAYFLLPKTLCADLESIIAKFWWQKGHAEQGWRLINFPNSLLAQVLKAKYFPNLDFIHAQLENLPSLTWKSIWAAKGLLQDDLCWHIGKGDRISVWNDCWIPGVEHKPSILMQGQHQQYRN